MNWSWRSCMLDSDCSLLFSILCGYYAANGEIKMYAWMYTQFGLKSRTALYNAIEPLTRPHKTGKFIECVAKALCVFASILPVKDAVMSLIRKVWTNNVYVLWWGCVGGTYQTSFKKYFFLAHLTLILILPQSSQHGNIHNISLTQDLSNLSYIIHNCMSV